MTALVAAAVTVCLISIPTQCERHDLRVEPRACRLAPIRGEAPVNGTWTPVEVRITCEK